MIHVQTYYLTAVLALALSGISLVVSLVSIAVSERHRKADRADKQASREADLAYKYSKEVQVSLPLVYATQPVSRGYASIECCSA